MSRSVMYSIGEVVVVEGRYPLSSRDGYAKGAFRGVNLSISGSVPNPNRVINVSTGRLGGAAGSVAQHSSRLPSNS